MEDEDYKKMKESASEFAGFLIRHEISFSQEINDYYDGLATSFEIKTRNNKEIIIFFRDNGYMGIEVNDDNNK